MTKAFMNRFCQGVGERPTILVQALMDGKQWYFRDLSPFYQRQAPPIHSKNAVASSVPRLFLFARPPAILGRVALLIVDAVNRVLQGWTFTHILEERLKGISPFQAHRNAAGSVLVVVAVVLIITTLDHISPGSVLGSLAHPVCGDSVKPTDLFPKAATASGVPVAQDGSSNDNGFSARAMAQPMEFFGFRFCQSQRCQPSEFLIGEISKIHTGIVRDTSTEFKRRISKCLTLRMC